MSPSSDQLCQGLNCSKPAALQCPSCVKLSIPGSFFCSQTCFKDNWVTIMQRKKRGGVFLTRILAQQVHPRGSFTALPSNSIGYSQDHPQDRCHGQRTCRRCVSFCFSNAQIFAGGASFGHNVYSMLTIVCCFFYVSVWWYFGLLDAGNSFTLCTMITRANSPLPFFLVCKNRGRWIGPMARLQVHWNASTFLPFVASSRCA